MCDMNGYHRRFCASRAWAEMVRAELLPWALDGCNLGADVLEIRPGFGATTVALARTNPAPAGGWRSPRDLR